MGYIGNESKGRGGIGKSQGVAREIDAKGDILVGTYPKQLDAFPLGANNYILTSDPSSNTGLKWEANPDPTGKAIAMAIVFG